MDVANIIIYPIIDELDADDFRYPIGIREAANHIGVSYSLLMDSVIAANSITDYYYNCESIGSTKCEGMH
jgi:hypothetical protein